MDDPLLVRGRQAACDLRRVVEGLAHREPAASEPLPQRLPFEKLRDDVWSAVLQPEVVNGENARMVER
jgi:hypothetical protein